MTPLLQLSWKNTSWFSANEQVLVNEDYQTISVPKLINIGPYLLKIFENVTRCWFILTHNVQTEKHYYIRSSRITCTCSRQTGHVHYSLNYHAQIPNPIINFVGFRPPKLEMNELESEAARESYFFSSRNIDSTFFITMSDIVGFSLTIASKLAGCDVLLGSTSSSLSSSDEDAEDEEWLICAADDGDDSSHAADVDSSASFGNGRAFVAIFGRLSAVAVIFVGTALPSQLVHCRFASVLPTTIKLKTNYNKHIFIITTNIIISHIYTFKPMWYKHLLC